MDDPTLEKIEDPASIRRLLTRSATDGSPARLAVGKGEDSFETQVLDRDFEKNGVVLKLPEALRAHRDRGAAFMVVIFSAGQRALAFQAKPHPGTPLHGDRRRELHLAYPKHLFRMQRRSTVRFDVPRGYDLQVELPIPGGERVKRKLFDLSPKGLAFVVNSQSELNRYPVGAFLRKVAILIHGRQILVDCQVRNRVPLGESESARRFKIGMSFLRVKEEDSDFILALGLTRMAPFVIKGS